MCLGMLMARVVARSALLPRGQEHPAEVSPAAGVYTAVLIGPISSEAEAMTTPACSEPSSHTGRAQSPPLFVRLVLINPFIVQAS